MYRYSVAFIVYFLLFSSIIKSQDVSDADSSYNTFYIKLTGGINNNDFKWSIAGPKNTPNILSELHWYDIKSFSTGIEFEGTVYKGLFCSADATYGSIYKGKNRDSDYGDDNKINEVFRSINRSDKGNLWNVSLGVGYMIPLSVGELKCKVGPSLGYYYGSQKFFITDAMQEIPFNAQIIGVNSTYKTKWKSNLGWIGLNLYIEFAERWWINMIYKYHDVVYYAEADWNLIDEFMHPKSFEHSAFGYGLQGDWSFGYKISNHISLNINIEYNNWTTGKGTDKLFKADGTTPITRLNNVTYHSFGVLTGISIVF